MDYLSIIIAGITGGIASLISDLVMRFTLKDNVEFRKKYGSWMIISIFFTISFITKPYIDPVVQRYNMDLFVNKMAKQIPLFLYVKEYDRKNYDLFLDKLITIKNSNKSQAEMTQMIARTSRQILSVYMLNCSKEAIIDVTKSQIDCMKELRNKKSLYVLQMESPRKYGTPIEALSQLNESTRQRYFDAWKAVVQSAKLNHRTDFDQKKIQSMFEEMLIKYFMSHPKEYKVVTNTDIRNTVPAQNEMADTIISYYDYLINYSTDSSDVFRLFYISQI